MRTEYGKARVFNPFPAVVHTICRPPPSYLGRCEKFLIVDELQSIIG